MGSFIRKCFISKQVIKEGEEVVLIPVYNSQSHSKIKVSDGINEHEIKSPISHLCYPDAYWTPFGYMFEAKSLDCGHYELTPSDFNHKSLILFFKDLGQSVFKTHKGKNQYHEQEFDFQSFFKYVDNFSEAINKQGLEKLDLELFEKNKVYSSFEMMVPHFISGRVFIDNNHHPSMVSFSVCSKKAYELCVEESKKLNYNRDVYEKIEKFKEFERPINHAFKLFPNEFYSIFNYYRGDGISLSYSHLVDDVLRNCEEMATKNNLLKIKDQDLKNVFDFEKFQEYLLLLELVYIPFFGASQDYSNDSGKRYAQLISQLTKDGKNG